MTGFKIAVVGTGSAGTRHLKVVRSIEDAVPIGVSIRPGRAAELAQEGFVTAPNIAAAAGLGAQAAIIATNTGRHLSDSLEALDRGLDLLVEKPLAVNSQEARQLLEYSQKLGRKLYVGCVLRFSESLNSFRQLLPKVGAVHSVEVASRSYLPNWRPCRDYKSSYSASSVEGGVLRDLIHEIDYTTWLFGWPKLVNADLRNLGQLGIEAEETADLGWETLSGGSVSVRLDYLSRPPIRFVKALGALGTLTWNGVNSLVYLDIGDADKASATAVQSRDDMFKAQGQAFLEAIQGVADERLATGEDGFKALAVCDAARTASSSGRPKEIQYLQPNLECTNEQ